MKTVHIQLDDEEMGDLAYLRRVLQFSSVNETMRNALAMFTSAVRIAERDGSIGRQTHLTVFIAPEQEKTK